MGAPQEKSGNSKEKRIEVSLGNGSIVIPFRFGRQPTSSEAMRARLDKYLISGAKAMEPEWVDQYDMTDEDIREELGMIANHTLERSPYYTLGLVLSEEGFSKYDNPFKSLNDPDIRDVFRSIADPLIGESYYNPAQISRRALFKDNISYPDGKKRSWDAGEVVSHLTIALAELGRPFNSKNDEHSIRISPHSRWPADLAEMFCIAYLLGEDRINENIKQVVINRMEENLDRVVDLGDLEENDRQQLVEKSNELAGSKVLM
jgi:hypothetical protein